MPSELGKFIRHKRTEMGIGLRELARLIDRSAPYLTQLELDDEPPPASDGTLRSIAKHLRIDSDVLFGLASRLPKELKPETSLEVALYRKVKGMSPKEQMRQLKLLGKRTHKPGAE